MTGRARERESGSATGRHRATWVFDRRQVLKGGLTVGAGLVLGLRLPLLAESGAAMAAGELAPNAFVRIGADDTVTVISKHLEFGQGTYTGLATILAEELDADWSTVRVEAAPADAERYANLFFGIQGTGGSTAMANSWGQMRQAGADARALLVAAAAASWEVPAGEIEVRGGAVRHPSGRSARFGDLVEAAAGMEVPAEVPLKDPEEFILVGREPTPPRVDVPPKTDGTAVFTSDLDLPDMLTAMIARPPRFGGSVHILDATAANAVPGVVKVVSVPRGVAVLAEGFWAAKKGRDALEIEWDEDEAEKRGSEELFAEYRALLDEPGLAARNDGDVEAALAGAETTLEAVYEFPYLAHAPMEPMDVVIQRTEEGGCEVWAGSQLQTVDQGTVARVLGLEPSAVTLHTLYAGGSFGRRATPAGDEAAEAASIVAASGTRRPVRLVWTREDDIEGGRYRPLYVHRLRAGIDGEGHLVGWDHRIVGQSIVKGTPFEAALVKDGIDESSVEGAADLPYAVPNLRVDLHTTDVGVPVLWWRSVGHTHTAFSTETFLDEVSRALGEDPVALRRRLLADHPRHLGVLDLVAEKADWGGSLPEGWARGVAVHESFSSFVAQVAEVSIDEEGMPRVHRVVCAVDCGIAINPDVIRAQMEGGIGFGLGAALHDEIVLEEGRVRESNFHDYRSLRIHEMPEVEVHIVSSGEAPTGVGEPGVPPIAPAVANAYAALTGEPVQRLPFRRVVKGGRS